MKTVSTLFSLLSLSVTFAFHSMCTSSSRSSSSTRARSLHPQVLIIIHRQQTQNPQKYSREFRRPMRRMKNDATQETKTPNLFLFRLLLSLLIVIVLYNWLIILAMVFRGYYIVTRWHTILLLLWCKMDIFTESLIGDGALPAKSL